MPHCGIHSVCKLKQGCDKISKTDGVAMIIELSKIHLKLPAGVESKIRYVNLLQGPSR